MPGALVLTACALFLSGLTDRPSLGTGRYGSLIKAPLGGRQIGVPENKTGIALLSAA